MRPADGALAVGSARPAVPFLRLFVFVPSLRLSIPRPLNAARFLLNMLSLEIWSRLKNKTVDGLDV